MRRILLAAAVVPLLVTGALAQTVLRVNQIADVQGVRTACGGASLEDQQAMSAQAYPIVLKLAGANGQWLGEERLTISGHGQSISVGCEGPWVAMQLPPGRYREMEQELEILPNGKISVPATGFLAGSWAFTDLCVGNVIRFADVSLSEAIDMASARPRELLGLPVARLQAGDRADLVLFDWEEGGDFRRRLLLQRLDIQPVHLDQRDMIEDRADAVLPAGAGPV